MINERLRGMMLVVGIVTIGGATYRLATRQPPDITMDELKDAGAVGERIDRWVLVCPEKISKQTKNYLKNNDYGDFAVGSIHRIARVVWEYDSDAGKLILNPSLIVSLDAGDTSDAGDPDNQTDDSFAFRLDDCYRVECNSTDGGLNELRFLSDGGFRHRKPDDTEQPWCNVATRRGRVTPPCVIPSCWTLSDGGWDDNSVVDCQATGPFGLPDGGPRWAGCNTLRSQFSTGSQCTPVECSVVAGDNPPDVLR